MSQDFSVLLGKVKEVSENVSGAVFIGGVAVYLHAIQKIERLAETSHDADLYVGLSDLTDLRDMEELVPNRRLNKQQFIKGGFEFDVYVERNNALAIPYDEILVESESVDDIRIAALGHLLVLKLDAALDRKGSAKGDKDIRDVIRILLMFNKKDVDVAKRFLREEHEEMLTGIPRSAAFTALAEGNAVNAKQYRTVVAGQIRELMPEARVRARPR